MAESRDLHVLIVGAGISGLLVAQGLKKRGISHSIFEAESSAAHYRPREWGMSVQWALPMLPDLLPDDLLARLQSTSVDPYYVFPDAGNSMPVYDASSGEHVKDVPLVKMIRVSRRKFRALCAEGIDIKYGKAIATVSRDADGGNINISFSDGTTAKGTILVAADGANSNARSLVFPDTSGLAHQVPYGGVNMHVRYGVADIARHLRKFAFPIQCIGVHPRGYWLWLSIQDVPDPEKPEDWIFQLQWTWKLGSSASTLDDMKLENLQKEASEVFGEPFRTAWLRIPEGTPVPANRISVWEPTPASNSSLSGRVALVGDAGHAMSFHRGQGMNHGINDAITLCAELAEAVAGQKDVHEAIRSYEMEMIARAGEEVRISRMNTEMMHDWQRLQESPFMQRGGDKNK